MAEPSLDIGSNGTLRLIKSYQAFEFNNAGMMRRNAVTSPLATGAASMRQSYQLSEKDVVFMETLGQGASGVVQKAFWPSRAEFVAVKKISILERDKRHQLMNDIKALCDIPDVTGLIRFCGAYHCADKGQVAVALEYMDAGSLADLCRTQGFVDQNALASITESILNGLAYLHSNHMVHRDIKPANILLSTSGQAKVSDFGISAFVDNTLAQCHTFLGTVTYMSPERIDGQPYSFPADIWALGLTLLECCTGAYPYDASKGTMQLMIQLMEDECPLPSTHENVSPALRDFIQRCMHKDPLRRPTAVELLRHPFMKQAGLVNLKSYMACMLDRDSQIHDASMTVTHKFYNNLAYNWSESDVTASFLDADVRLTSGPFGPEAETSRKVSYLRGQYTVAAHFHDMIRQIGSKACFDLTLRRMKYKEREGSFLVNIMQKVRMFDCHTKLSRKSDQSAVGVYEETIVVEVTSIDALHPGKGFRFLSQDIRWTKPLILNERPPPSSDIQTMVNASQQQNGCKTQ